MTPRSPSASGSTPCMSAATSRSMLKVPIRLILMTRSKSASGIGPSRPTMRLAGPTPAQLMRIRAAPCLARACASAATAWSESVTSQAIARPPIVSATLRAPSRLTSRQATLAPAPSPASGASSAACSPPAAASSGSATSSATTKSPRRRRRRSTPTSCSSPKPPSADPGCEGLFFLPYLTGERCPHPDPMRPRRLDRHHRPHHRRDMLIRSLLEGVTFGMRDALEIMKRDEHPHHPGPRQRRRRPQRLLAATPGRHLQPARSSSPTPPKAPPTASRCSPASAPASGRASKKPASPLDQADEKIAPNKKLAARYDRYYADLRQALLRPERPLPPRSAHCSTNFILVKLSCTTRDDASDRDRPEFLRHLPST